MLLKPNGFDITIEEDEYRELFERVNKNVPMKDEYLEKIIEWELDC